MTQKQFDFHDIDAPARPRLARGTDPDTSHAAAERQIRSGRRDSNKRRLWDAVVERPEMTSAEYARLTGIDRVEAARRLADLKNDGKIAQLPQRYCSVKGTLAMTWGPVWPQR